MTTMEDNETHKNLATSRNLEDMSIIFDAGLSYPNGEKSCPLVFTARVFSKQILRVARIGVKPIHVE